jgi:energy-coupling factor transporter ATP-binding protein EcfA2
MCSVIRGRCESRSKIQSTVIQEKKNDLTKFDSYSTNALYDALYVLDIEYKGVTKLSTRKVFFENLPRFLKQMLYVILVWGFVKTMASGDVYSESYLILTAYGTILGIAEEIGKIFEKTIEISQMRKDSSVKAVNDFERKEKELLEKNRGTVSLTEEGLEISTDFAVDVKGATGKTRYYKLLDKLYIPKGKHVIFSGEKEVGKTRFLTFLETLYPFEMMIYNDNSKIFNQFYDNFKTAHKFDGELIRELAKGLRLKRFMELSDEELKKMQITNINTGDKHLCVALVMLYFAIKDPDTAKIIIFDELLANVDEENSKKILAFIMQKVEEIGSTVIFVGHSQQTLIQQYCSSQIKLVIDGEAIVVTQNKF